VTDQPIHCDGWTSNTRGGARRNQLVIRVTSYRAMNFNALFDGILLMEHTTPSRPTLNARQNVARRLRI